MISLELAEKLKKAGLNWEPKEGDAYINQGGFVQYLRKNHVKSIIPCKCIWLPRLDQLLTEIECFTDSKYKCLIMRGENEIDFISKSFKADTIDDAAGQALLWILQYKLGGIDNE